MLLRMIIFLISYLMVVKYYSGAIKVELFLFRGKR